MLTQLPTIDIVAEFPATASQRRFWYLHQLDPQSVANNISVQWELQGACPDETIEAAFRAIAARHEILRTRFVERDGEVIQQVAEAPSFRLGTIDLRHLAPDDHRARIDGIAAQMVAEPFDLSHAGLFRVTLVRSAPDWCSLLIAAHHAVFDGYSIRVLGEEFGQSVAALLEDRSPDLPDLPLQYGDYARWQAACETAQSGEHSRAFWLGQLADMPRTQLVSDTAAESGTPRQAARVNIPMDPDFGDQLARAAAALDVSPFVAGAAVMGAALQRVTQQDDISFGTAFSGRTESELDDLIGVFINPVVLRTRLNPDAPLSEAVLSTATTVREALAHGDYPFDTLVGDLNLPREREQTPLVSAMFALAPVFLQEQSYGPVSLVSVASQTPDITHDLSVNVIGRGSGWLMMVDYDAARLSAARIQAFCDTLLAGFAALNAGAQAPLSEISAPSEGNAKQIPAPDQALDLTPDNGAESASVEAPLQVATPQLPAPAPTAPDARVRTIWSTVLGLPEDACDGDFFALGGHSLLALRLLAQTEKAFGLRPPLPGFLENPTLAGYTALVEQALPEQPPVSEPAPGPSPNSAAPEGEALNLDLIWLRQGDPDTPVVVTLNQPFLYVGLARTLAGATGCVNLHVADPAPLRSRAPALWSDLVNACAARIASATAGRPLLLLGQCVDGVLAFCVAQRLAEIGHPVRSLAMIDSWAPRPEASISAPRRLARKVWFRLRRLGLDTGDLLRGQLTPVAYLSRSRPGQWLAVALKLAEAPTDVEQGELETNEHLQALVAGTARTGLPAYRGDALLFATARQTARAREDRFGWGTLLEADVPVFTLPGWHEDALLRNGTDRIAAILDARLSRMGRRQRPGPVSGPASGRVSNPQGI